jgi:HK97 gp10 family phage protein
MEDFNNWSKIAEAFDTAQSQVVRKTAFDLQAHMQKQIRANHQIDTGFMTNSVYVRTFDESNYGLALAKLTTPSSKPTKSGKPRKLSKKKQALKARLEAAMLAEVERPPDNKTAYVGVGAAYGWFQNYGTSRQPARPFLEPAIEIVRPGFDEALRRIDEKLREISH